MNTQLQRIEDIKAYLKSVRHEDVEIRWDSEESFEFAEEVENAPTGAFVIDDWLCLAPGHMLQKTLRAPQATLVPWWYLYTYRTMSNYPHAPDDVETLPLGDNQSFHVAAKVAISLVLERAMDAVDESHMAREFCECTKLEWCEHK